MSKRAEAACVLFGFACLAVAVTYPVVLRMPTHIPSDLADPLLTAWTLAWDAGRMLRGLRGIWDAPTFYPYSHTLLYSDHLLGIAIFTAPFQWLSGNPVLVYNIAFLASFVLSGVGMYVLVRHLTGRRDAAIVASLIYACQPFRVSHLSHLQWLMTGWLPLSVWALHRYFSTGAARHLFACTVFFLLQSLTAAYFTYFGTLPLLMVGGVEVWRTRFPLKRLVLHLIPAALLVAVVMAPIARAYYEVRQQLGLKRSTADIVTHSADVSDYFSAAPRLRLWGGLGRGRGEHELFPGAAVLIVAAIGIAAARSSPAPRMHTAVSNVRGPSDVTIYAALLLAAFVLSLGPTPKVWGHEVGVPGPYALLLHIVPGLDGLRAAARLAVIAQLALSVLAGFGVVRVVDRLRPRFRFAATAAIAATVIAEGWAAPLTTLPLDLTSGDRDAYAYMRSLPSGPIMELPTSLEETDPEFVYQYMTLSHRHRIVNGHSGYVSPLALWLGGGHSPFREYDRQRDALTLLRAIGVRYVIVHRALYMDTALADEVLRVINGEPAQVVMHRTFGDTTVALLAPLPLPEVPSNVSVIEPAAIRPSASQSHERLRLLFDGNRDTRWLTGRAQTGTEWLSLELDRPRDVRVVRLQLGVRSFGDYPRDLAIDVMEDSGARTVFRGTVLPQFARGLIADGEYPFVDIVLPPNRARTLRLRQLGSTPTFFWSLHELRLLERS